MTPGLRGCHLTYLYVPGQYFSAEDRITAATIGQCSGVITPYIFIIILDRDSGVRPLVIIRDDTVQNLESP